MWLDADCTADRSAVPIATRLLWAESLCEVVNCNKLNTVLSVFSSSYTVPTALGTTLSKRLNKLGLTFFIQLF